MANAPEPPADESVPPGVIEVITTPGRSDAGQADGGGMGAALWDGQPRLVWCAYGRTAAPAGTGCGSVDGVSRLPRQGVFGRDPRRWGNLRLLCRRGSRHVRR